MRQTWRWFGPADLVSLDDARQAGVEGIVTALHQMPTGAVWLPAEIAKRQEEVRAGGLDWEVVESLPVSEDIKKQNGDWRAHVEAWRKSLANLKLAGIRVVCYNFMPVLDWTRTDLGLAAAERRHLHALRPDRFRGVRHLSSSSAPMRRRTIPEEVARGRGAPLRARCRRCARDALARNVSVRPAGCDREL